MTLEQFETLKVWVHAVAANKVRDPNGTLTAERAREESAAEQSARNAFLGETHK